MNRLIPLAFSLTAVVACVPSYEAAPDKAAARYCDRANECGNLQEGEYEDCVDISEDGFQALWSFGNCEETGFDRGQWRECWETIGNWSCDDGLAGWGQIGDRCEPAEVCPN